MTQWSEWYTLLYKKYSDKCTPKNIKNLVTELSNLWSCARINHCADFVFWTYSLVIHSIYFSSELNYHSLMNTVMSLWFKVIVHARTCFFVYWRYNKLVFIKTAPLFAPWALVLGIWSFLIQSVGHIVFHTFSKVVKLCYIIEKKNLI